MVGNEESLKPSLLILSVIVVVICRLTNAATNLCSDEVNHTLQYTTLLTEPSHSLFPIFDRCIYRGPYVIA